MAWRGFQLAHKKYSLYSINIAVIRSKKHSRKKDKADAAGYYVNLLADLIIARCPYLYYRPANVFLQLNCSKFKILVFY